MENPNSWKGLHWIVDEDGNLLIAPVGNHNVEGLNNSCMVENKWSTYALNGEPLVVREDMISVGFKTEIPIANYVLVAGKYIFPEMDIWTDMIDGWTETHAHVGGVVAPTIQFGICDTRIKGLNSLKWYWSLPSLVVAYSMFYRQINIEWLKLITRDNPITINLRFYGKWSMDDLKLRLFCQDEEPTWELDGAVEKTKGTWLEADIKKFIGDEEDWNEVTIEITTTDLEDIDKGKVWTRDKYGNYSDAEWEDVKYIAIVGSASGGVLGWEFTHYIDDMCIVGNVIRGIFTSDCGESTRKECKKGCIKHYGCRFLTIKDSIASTDTLNPDDMDSSLSQLALYELLRNRIIRTSGQITIPLTPDIKAGQLVWIRSSYNPDGYNYDLPRVQGPSAGREVTVVNGSKIVTGNFDFTTFGVGMRLFFPDEEWYTITGIVNETVLHIDRPYGGENDSGEIWTISSPYMIDKDFRIIEVRHVFQIIGANTLLTLTDDLWNSIPINTMDPYSITMRAINPDYQTKTLSSLKISGGDFNSLMTPISKDTKDWET
jgi:hypothetical protein